MRSPSRTETPHSRPSLAARPREAARSPLRPGARLRTPARSERPRRCTPAAPGRGPLLARSFSRGSCRFPSASSRYRLTLFWMSSNASGDDPLMRPPSEGELRIVPLGGRGEVGMNCLALEDARGILVVGCGVSFPDDDLGIDTYHPDLSYLEARRERVLGVFLTHGHEDHVGALPYLLKTLDVPVWGPPHALAVARHRI